MSDIVKDLECLNVGDDQWVYECAQRAIGEIERLRAKNARMKCERDEAIADAVLVKSSADYHKSQSCMETQYEIIRQRCEALVENARLREALESVMRWNNKLALCLPPEALPTLAAARAALAEQDKKS